MTALLRSLASRTTRRPGRAIALLLVLLLAVIAGGVSAGGQTVDDFTVPGIESQKAQDLIGERFPAQKGDSATVVLHVDRGQLRDGHRASAIRSAVRAIERQPHVTGVEDPLAAGQLSRDGRTAFTTVSYDAEAGDDGMKAKPRERLEDATAPLAKAGVEVSMQGQVVDAGNEGSMPIGELAGVVLALALLLLVLRSARAALSSLLTAFLGLALGFGLMGLATLGVDIPSLAPQMAAMLGLGAGIDYALLSAARHQEELRRGRTPAQAAVRTNATAGHSAVTAAGIVLVSISGLLVTGIPFVGKVGVVAGLFVVVSSIVAVLLLPPLFAAGGRRMLPRRERAHPAEPDEAVARPGLAVRRPWIALTLGAVVAIGLAIPATGLELGQPDNGNQPTDQTQRTAYDRLAAAFGPGFNGPLVITVDGDRGRDVATAASRVERAVAGRPDVASVTPPTLNGDRDAALLTVFPRSSPQDSRTADLVHDLRDETIPLALQGTDGRALVGGYNARLVDEAQRISDRLPLFAVVVVGLSLLLLAITFRSLKVAILSAVLNLVSIAAAYGIIHLLFQTSGGTDLIGVEIQPVVPYVPLFMFAILFGLSTDYNVFLLSRVREEWKRLGHVPPAVAQASARTRWTITAAGLIMIVVFLGFATDPDTTIKMSGFGLASAILVDITLVRWLLAPAALTLLGDRLWGPGPDRGDAPTPGRPGRPATVEPRP
ncbi:MMPL family transporter [Patulibacter defluvii]|uniref:MMPL family transporter n=1 Tax=Patulibacter defluvii TaxID=3095358 RepID=UPI002A759B54|nr:MMPL family transporter [Patulibacter sp. DM4]